MKKRPPITKGTIIRTAVLVIALINQFLVSAGYSPLPINDENSELVVSTILTAVAAMVAWWKDNDITPDAREQKKG